MSCNRFTITDITKWHHSSMKSKCFCLKLKLLNAMRKLLNFKPFCIYIPGKKPPLQKMTDKKLSIFLENTIGFTKEKITMFNMLQKKKS